jgi:hypothetical protein
MRVFGAFLILVLAVGCQAPPAEMTEAERAQIEAEVLAWSEVWEEGWEPANRCEILRALFHPDHPVRLAGGEPQGRDGWFEFCMSNYATWVSFSGTWGDREVRVISPDAAVLITRYDGTWEFEDGTTDRRPAGVHRILLERAPDGWGATFMQNSAGPSAEE